MITYRLFDSLSDFEQKNIRADNQQLSFSKNALYAAAVTVGSPYKYHNSNYFPKEILNWKTNIIHTFIDKSSLHLRFKNVSFLESSEKGAVGFFIGMIFAHLYAQIQLEIKFTEHLSNESITPNLRPGNRSRPDLWGIAKSGQSYLIEAKGSFDSSDFSKIDYIRKAETQLKNVTSIDFKYSTNQSKTYKGSNLKKIIVSTFAKLPVRVTKKNQTPGIPNQIYLDVIDPEGAEKKKVTVDGDEMVFKYYYFLVSMLSDQETEEKFLNGTAFILYTIPCEGLKIGLMKDIYNLLNIYVKEYEENIQNNLAKSADFFRESNLYRKINGDEQDTGILNLLEGKRHEIETDAETKTLFSVGIDGVVVITE
ncbi:hypothetical protein QCD85_09995 [Paenibacillus sp. PsM32]|uniref:hypothetical protein n=1 Tax=Paenibacillus sp. PsM32 TaxID=3030536 RepID=UPI00263B503C|nr:hypothetical protein [Paenibacillus sp. PsM32]MDN4618428.1 hypothetical protein [Paenibacillus sp. PsM32]